MSSGQNVQVSLFWNSIPDCTIMLLIVNGIPDIEVQFTKGLSHRIRLQVAVFQVDSSLKLSRVLYMPCSAVTGNAEMFNAFLILLLETMRFPVIFLTVIRLNGK